MFTYEFINDFKSFSDTLATNSYWHHPNVFQDNVYQTLSEAFERRRSLLRPAQIGKGTSKKIKSKVRNDFITWVDINDNAFLPASHLLELVSKKAREELFLPIKRFEAQLALYPKGHYYKIHVDRHKTNPSRLLSLVFYFNKWSKGDGGELVLNFPNQKIFTFPPLQNSLIIFLSELEHEVLTAQKERRSLTCWFRDDVT